MRAATSAGCASATPVWGFLEERLDRRIAVSEQARESAQRWLPGDYEIVPNGVLIPAGVEPGGREHRVVFAGRQEPRKGLQILLRAWPEIRRRTGARLRIAGADPLAVRLLLTRLRVSDDGIDVLGFLTQEPLTAELASAKALIAPSLGGESFGMVLTRAFACATPVVASDIPGYRDVMTPETSVAVPPGDPGALADAVEALLADEAGRARARRGGQAARDRPLLVAGHRAPARADLRRRPRRRGRDGGGVNVLPRSRWLRAALGLPVLALVAGSLWWRGPDWNVVYHAFDLVNWAWVGFALGLNLVSVLLRSLAWKLTIDQALEPPEPRFTQVFSAFSVGMLGNAVLPGRIGELARVAVLRRHLPRGRGSSGTLVGTVFAHRLFDLPAALLLILYVALTAKVPHWAITSLVIVSIMGVVLFTVAFVTARRHHRPLDGARSLRQLLSMARQGLAVLRSPWPALGAILLQCAGWLMQLFAVYVSMRAFDIHALDGGRRPRAAADERRDDLPALARQHRPAPGRGRAAARPVRRSLLRRVCVRARPAGDRDVGRRRRRPRLPRARGPLVREPAGHARRERGAGGRGGRDAIPREAPCARSRARLASRAS